MENKIAILRGINVGEKGKYHKSKLTNNFFVK